MSRGSGDPAALPAPPLPVTSSAAATPTVPTNASPPHTAGSPEPRQVVPHPPLPAEASATGDGAAPLATAPQQEADNQPPLQHLTQRLLPRPPQHHGRRAIILFLLTLLMASIAHLAERPLARLAPSGLLPTLLQFIVVGGRLSALLLAFGGLLHLVPDAWTPAVPYVLIGVALASPVLARPLVAVFGVVYRRVFGSVGTLATALRYGLTVEIRISPLLITFRAREGASRPRNICGLSIIPRDALIEFIST